MSFRGIVLAGGGAVAFLASGLAWAEGDKAAAPAPKISPIRALQEALTKLQRAPNYRAKAAIEGGISEKEDHSISERTVSEAYEGEVFGSLMHVPTVKAYRYPKKGVAFIDGNWRRILSDQKTALLDRLFTFPEVLLGRAVSHPESARWLTLEEEKARGLSSSEETEAGDDPAKDDTKKVDAPRGKPAPGKTVASKPGTAAKAGVPEGPLPRVVRVEVPPKEALTHFIEVQNSGCMSAG